MITKCADKLFHLRAGFEKYVNARRRCPFAALFVIAFFCVAAAIAAPAQTFTSMVSFDVTNGANPQWGPLVQGPDGNLYGTTSGGGVYSGGCFRSPDGYCGTVFKIAPGRALTTLHEFTNGADGSGPMPGLILATDRDFYGVNANGGNFGFCFGIGCGAAFKITPAGTLTPLFDFTFSKAANPGSALVEAMNGNFYGTSVNGGIGGCGPSGDGCGMIFEMTPEGELTVLHDFDFNDGWDSVGAALIQSTGGILYGETAGGGNGNFSNSYGTIFTITPVLGKFTVLYKFNGSDGQAPLGGLVQASDGNFFGITPRGGAHGDGTVFRITPQGTLTTLHSFDGTDGANPQAGLLQATDGNFYGTTYGGETSGNGTVFEMTPGGTLTTLHSFDGTDGANPQAGLLQATDGNFYGTTYGGGTSGNGTVFSLSVGLRPFITFLPAARPVGGTVEILGQGFTDATAVSFNGTPATFTVASDTYLTAKVPAGATTGHITVTEPSGTLKSNKIFHVLPQIFSFSPTSGPVGTKVVITGESFTGANGVELACKISMSFTVDSDTQITAIVPADGTTGKLMVFTPGGNVETSAKFTVTP
jgi:uncharacterized repeat protein (TIGR03803 family)